MAKEIIIEATPEGEVTVTANGYKGKSCYEATKAFEEALGVSKSDEKTKEYFEKPVKTTQKIRQ